MLNGMEKIDRVRWSNDASEIDLHFNMIKDTEPAVCPIYLNCKLLSSSRQVGRIPVCCRTVGIIE